MRVARRGLIALAPLARRSAYRTMRGVVLSLSAITACVSARHGKPDVAQPRVTIFVPSQSPERLITAAELATLDVRSLGEAIARLRPELLSWRRRAIPGRPDEGPEVYLDNQPAGGLESLESIPRMVVTRVDFLTPMEAAARFGSQHFRPVILVRTQSRM